MLVFVKASPMDYTLYEKSLTAADHYKKLDREFTEYVMTIKAFNPPTKYFTMKAEVAKAKRNFEKAQKEWLNYYHKNKGDN